MRFAKIFSSCIDRVLLEARQGAKPGGKRTKLKEINPNKPPEKLIPKECYDEWYAFITLYYYGSWRNKKALQIAYGQGKRQMGAEDLRNFVLKMERKKKYEDKYPISKIKDTDEQLGALWGTWMNFIRKRGKMPYLQHTGHYKDAQAILGFKFINAHQKLMDRCRAVCKDCIKAGIMKIGNIYKEQPNGAMIVNNNKAIISTAIRFSLTEFPSREFARILKNHGWVSVTTDNPKLQIGEHLIEIQKSKKEMYFVLTVSLAKAEALFIVEGKDEDFKDKEKIAKGLMLHSKKVLNEEGFSRKMAAEFKLEEDEDEQPKSAWIDFESAEEEDDELIDKIIQTVKDAKNPSDKIFEYNLDYLRSLNNPLFAYHMAKALYDYCSENEIEPLDTWEHLLDDPNEYLNPLFILEEIEEDHDSDDEL